jgi:hypothetical protein
MKKFKDIKIEAGYLLKIKYVESTEYMTILPDKEDDLGCCTPKKHWWPLYCFDGNGVYERATVMEIYGRTCNRNLLDNSPEYRKLLWKREEEPQVVDMTLAEIQEKLGHPFRIVPEKAE